MASVMVRLASATHATVMRALVLGLVLCVASACSADPGEPAPTEAVNDAAAPVDVAAEASAVCSDPPVGTVVKVSVGELESILVLGANVAIVDVREPAETERGVIAGALLYPWISGVLKAKHAELPKDRPLYVICGSGTRSAQATAFLASNGHACVHDTMGGMSAWTAAAYPIVKP